MEKKRNNQIIRAKCGNKNPRFSNLNNMIKPIHCFLFSLMVYHDAENSTLSEVLMSLEIKLSILYEVRFRK